MRTCVAVQYCPKGTPQCKLGERRAEARTVYAAVSRPERNAVKRERSVVEGAERPTKYIFTIPNAANAFHLLKIGHIDSVLARARGAGGELPLTKTPYPLFSAALTLSTKSVKKTAISLTPPVPSLPTSSTGD